VVFNNGKERLWDKESIDKSIDQILSFALNRINRRISSIPPLIIDKKVTAALDRDLHSEMGRFIPISPGSIATAYYDWLVHLSLSPGKQIDLLQSSWHYYSLFFEYLSLLIANIDSDTDVQPLFEDRRFSDPAWHKWPYNAYHQAFLVIEKWWCEATCNVRGMTQHHLAILPFITRQCLDTVAPLNFPFSNPLVIQETLQQKGANFISGFNNFMEDLQRSLNKEPPVGSEEFKVGHNIAVTKGNVIYKNRLIELIQYAPLTSEVYAEPILIIPAWIMKYYILDLSPENSLVKYLVEKGHTVFMISWKNPDEKDWDLGFEEYMNLGIMEALKVISTITPDQSVHAVGYCLGGTLLAIAAAALSRNCICPLKTITLFAAQVDFDDAGELLFFIDESQVAFIEDIMMDKGYLDASYMAGTFFLLRSYDLIWSRLVENYLLGKRQKLNDLMAWNADATRMPYRMHSEYLRSLFLNNDLTSGHFKIGGQPVILHDIATPIFSVSTLTDHVAPWQSAYKIHFYTDSDVTFVLTNGGHNAGIISEPGHPRRRYQMATRKVTEIHMSPEEWHQQTPYYDGSWWPAWAEWLASHSSGKTPCPLMGNPEAGYHPLYKAPGKYVLIK
jgi:polyhydroxyalkanoate synthase